MRNNDSQKFIWHIDELEELESQRNDNLVSTNEVLTSALAVGVTVVMVSLIVWFATR